jgi:hypothetical protein
MVGAPLIEAGHVVDGLVVACGQDLESVQAARDIASDSTLTPGSSPLLVSSSPLFGSIPPGSSPLLARYTAALADAAPSLLRASRDG